MDGSQAVTKAFQVARELLHNPDHRITGEKAKSMGPPPVRGWWDQIYQ